MPIRYALRMLVIHARGKALLLVSALGLVACKRAAAPSEPSPNPAAKVSQPTGPSGNADAAPSAATPPSSRPEPQAGAADPLLPPSAPPDLNETQKATLARARARAQEFAATLKSTLLEALREGPAAALNVCAVEAQRLTQEAQGDDVALGRASLRLRNPENRPPAWVQAQLERWGERKVQGLTPVVSVDERDVRLMVPIPVEGVCVTCHGARESLAPELRTLLSKRYPEDRAVGYAMGDLRGVLWAIARVEPD